MSSVGAPGAMLALEGIPEERVAAKEERPASTAAAAPGGAPLFFDDGADEAPGGVQP